MNIHLHDFIDGEGVFGRGRCNILLAISDSPHVGRSAHADLFAGQGYPRTGSGLTLR
jgi:hypothetical protein